MNETGAKHSEHVGPFQFVVLILSVVVLGALGADTIFKFPQSVSNILQVLDTVVCVLLLVDFGIRFHRSPSKLAFMKWGWIDLLASIPYIPWLRAGRILRILRVIRLLRAIRATQKISSLFLHNKLQTGVASVGLSAFLLIVFCSIGHDHYDGGLWRQISRDHRGPDCGDDTDVFRHRPVWSFERPGSLLFPEYKTARRRDGEK
jgi:voltage-gated potassium channel